MTTKTNNAWDWQDILDEIFPFGMWDSAPSGHKRHQARIKEIIEGLLSSERQRVRERVKLLKEQELPKACEDYSGNVDERIHFNDGYSEALSDILKLLDEVVDIE